MPRYPGLVRTPINIDMSSLTGYLAQDKLMDKEIGAKKDLSRLEFEQNKQLRGVDTQEAIKLRQFELEQQALANVLKREGMPEEQIQRVIASHANEKENQQKFLETQTSMRRMLGENEPEVLYGNEKATLLRPGLENRSLESSTTRGNILNQYLPQREQAEIGSINANTRAQQQGIDQRGLLFPFEKTSLENKAIQSGIIHLEPGINLNVPSGQDGRPYNVYNVSPFERPQPGGMDFAPDPKDPSKTTVVPRPTIPAQPASIFPMGGLDNLTPRPTNTPQASDTLTPDAQGYIYRRDPATGKLMRAKLRN